MKTCSKCSQTKPFEAFHRQPNGPMGFRSACKDCAKLSRLEKSDVERETRRAYYDRTRDEKRRYYQQVAKATKPVRDAKYRQSNKQKVAAVSAKRRAEKLCATPMWANKEAIREVYDFAQEFRDAGFDVHVDHIIPLQGHEVSGLHVEHNLRVCLADVNRAKGNRLLEQFI